MGRMGLRLLDDESGWLGDANASWADADDEENAFLASLYATATTNGEDTVMGQEHVEGLFTPEETSAVFTAADSIGVVRLRDGEELTNVELDSLLGPGDADARADEVADALSFLPANADTMMRVAGDLLNQLDDERAMALMLERSCRLQPEDAGSLARQQLLRLWNEHQQNKRVADAARNKQRESEVAIIQALGPCAALAFEAAE